MITTQYDETMLDCIAMATYYANQAYRVAIGQRPGEPWPLISLAKKQGIKAGILKALSGLTPEQMHENWMLDKTRAGYTYGPVENEHEKTHPCIKPWHQLSAVDKAKDELFIRVVHAMVDAIETGRAK